MNDILTGFKPVTPKCYEEFRKQYMNIEFSEFFYSITQMINDKFYYGYIDEVLVFIKTSTIMGNFSLLAYVTPIHFNPIRSGIVISELLKNGIGIKIAKDSLARCGLMNKLPFLEDQYGEEFIYSADNFIEMKGGDFSRHRHEIKEFNADKNFSIINNSKFIPSIVENWTNERKEKHQLKLLKTILTNKQNLNIQTLFYSEIPLGFSITETLNEKNAIILQRLINPVENPSKIKELNYILHYMDCAKHPGKLLNIGSCCAIKNMAIAKEKLRPIFKQKMIRIRPAIKTTRELYFEFKESSK